MSPRTSAARCSPITLQNKVYETDAQGKVVWEQAVTGVWAVKGLPNGHRLISSYTDKFLVEYDAIGKEIWRFDDLPNKPYSVQRLPNGNTLVPIYGNEILEIRPGQIFRPPHSSSRNRQMGGATRKRPHSRRASILAGGSPSWTTKAKSSGNWAAWEIPTPWNA